MELIGTLVHPENGGGNGYIVEFVADTGDVVSVQLRQTEDRSITRTNAPEVARSLLQDIGTKDVSEGGHRPEETRWSNEDGDLNDALKDTFPASDPVSMASTVTGSGTANGQE
ncbi:hypothetical protein [Allorhizobium taibaishanense]|uniref:Uncharacterized protein n=1 Tax=Allorhizobium taibaishanense TaxID=887144 RepID=A0A1Q9A9K8_9HYPH|nr:hypothetical protein [Allorhizobium taibaishanense]MBB4009852.1 hypothetical protein [Allorhizobium taibaishanense]OLP51488.1 hypothetical protein BJF91_15680 [Allorhizobium taibaishanense]